LCFIIRASEANQRVKNLNRIFQSNRVTFITNNWLLYMSVKKRNVLS